MRLPRRVPWSSIAELKQVCAWIYTDENDVSARLQAINRLSAWRAITPLPHALESTLALLVVILQDRDTSEQSLNKLSLRQSYAVAVIRLVNGLVDPLQLGAYARSIASIAVQLGLPGWLVELRHAATHEDLPSLELLREAARQSMEWLLHNYFLPTINPASVPQREAPSLRPLTPLLKRYKIILKTITRDVSLRNQYKEEVNVITRDIERWIAEAKVAANVVVGELGWDAAGSMTGDPPQKSRDHGVGSKEKWALEQFCDVLLFKGGLVSPSKKKRALPDDKFWPPGLSISLWAPLLKHVQLLHPDFAYVLCTRIITVLTEEAKPALVGSAPADTTSSQLKNDPSYDACLARWVLWAIDTFSNTESSNAGSGNEVDLDLTKKVAISLMQALGRRLSDPYVQNNGAADALLHAICQQRPSYQAALEFLSQTPSQLLVEEWSEQDMTIMTKRLTLFLSSATELNPMSASISTSSSVTPPAAGSTFGAVDASVVDVMPIETGMLGWRRLDTTSWRPCPIGVFYHSGESASL